MIWNPLTGERLDIALSELQGDVTPVDWSPDGRYLLLQHMQQAVQQLYLYDLADEKLIRLDHFSGSLLAFMGVGTYFASNDEIYAN